ncbi:hypothetical protein V1294_006949 [Bradyrhizobium sp. AZCC 1678]
MTRLGITLLTAVGLLLVGATSGQAACCSYGCCDCSCVAFRSEAKAVKLSRALGARGRLQSFTVDASDQKATPGPFKCSVLFESAICTRQ